MDRSKKLNIIKTVGNKGEVKMDNTKKNGYSAKVTKTFRGEDMPGYNATLFKDGKKIGTFDQYGAGGPLEIGLNDAELKKIQDYTATLGNMPGQFSDLAWDAELFLEELASDFLEEKNWRTRCKTKTLFRLKEDGENAYRQIKTPYSPEFAKGIRTKFADTLVEIINERYLGKVA